MKTLSIPAEVPQGTSLCATRFAHVPLAGIEPASPPSEGGILSIERQGRTASIAT